MMTTTTASAGAASPTPCCEVGNGSSRRRSTVLRTHTAQLQRVHRTVKAVLWLCTQQQPSALVRGSSRGCCLFVSIFLYADCWPNEPVGVLSRACKRTPVSCHV
jgi:hypothetical protein